MDDLYSAKVLEESGCKSILAREKFLGLIDRLWVSIEYESLVLTRLRVEPFTKQSGEYLVVKPTVLFSSFVDGIQQFLVVRHLPRVIIIEV